MHYVLIIGSLTLGVWCMIQWSQLVAVDHNSWQVYWPAPVSNKMNISIHHKPSSSRLVAIIKNYIHLEINNVLCYNKWKWEKENGNQEDNLQVVMQLLHLLSLTWGCVCVYFWAFLCNEFSVWNEQTFMFQNTLWGYTGIIWLNHLFVCMFNKSPATQLPSCHHNMHACAPPPPPRVILWSINHDLGK